MKIDQIREALANSISSSEEWINQLDESNPGHYGVEDWDVNLSLEDIWVNIPQKTFTFKNAFFNFELLLGSSNYADGFKMGFSRVAIGNGRFDFSTENDGVKIEEIIIEFDLDLFDGE